MHIFSPVYYLIIEVVTNGEILKKFLPGHKQEGPNPMGFGPAFLLIMSVA